MRNNNCVLKVENLNVFYDEFQAIKNVNLNFEKNKITAFIGASGCGKSTFLKCLNLINRENKDCKILGKIIYNDKNINTENQDVYNLRKSIGIVFQKPTSFNKSIYKNISFALKRHGICDKKQLDFLVESSLKQAGLWEEVKDDLNKNAMNLSGGQQQRLCIARTIALKPDIILLDEPTSALDPISSRVIEELILKLKKDFTVIIVTHNMNQAKRISDNTAFFHLGSVVEYEKTKQLFLNPQKEKTREYISGIFG